MFALFYKQTTAAMLLCAALVWLALSPALAAEKPLTIVAFGDSLTAGYLLGPGEGFVPQLQKALRAKGHNNVVIADAGVSGDTSSGGLARLDWGVGPGTSAVILELGANDALRGVDPELTRANLEEILSRLQKRNIPVLLAGMLAPPNMGADYGKAFDAIYPQLAAKYGAVFYPFFLDGVAAEKKLTLDDGMHPNAEGVAIMVKRILPKVEALIAKTSATAQGN
jgi:acyl-CoA thioesterase-1